MRVLLVTNANELDKKLAALNPDLEYCGIVVDEVQSAKKALETVGLSQVPLYPMNELEACVKKFNQFYILCVAQDWCRMGLMRAVKKILPTRKIIDVWAIHTPINFLLERSLRYFKEHVAEFEMFATGISPTEKGIEPAQFKRKLFNFGRGSQDLYYNFQVAKFVISSCGGGHSKLRYALIGLTPYIFHWDVSKSNFQGILLQHFIAFNNLHNFSVPAEVYRSFFNEEWLTKKLSVESFDINIPYGRGTKLKGSMDQKAIDADSNTWKGRYFLETRDENIKILDDYLTLCEGNNIRPVMFTVRVSEKYIANFDKRLFEEFYSLVEQACQKHPSAVFFDGWKLKDFTYADFYDHAHLNVHGAAKFSTYLNDFIEELEFNYYKDLNNFYNRMNDSIE